VLQKLKTPPRLLLGEITKEQKEILDKHKQQCITNTHKKLINIIRTNNTKKYIVCLSENHKQTLAEQWEKSIINAHQKLIEMMTPNKKNICHFIFLK